ncbi:hypothetical protein GCM10027037_02710 [Mucilaginibacter koreensis]
MSQSDSMSAIIKNYIEFVKYSIGYVDNIYTMSPQNFAGSWCKYLA